MTERRMRTQVRSDPAPRLGADILYDLDCETLTFNGEEISMLEAGIRLLYSRSLKGDIGASLDLQRIRDRCGAESVPRPAGVLVVPEKVTLEEFERRASEQQRQFREKPNPDDEL